ncbi:hypothetical protein CEXT_184031 [Caerostris extrusa]|uniref:Uncharacterized protein n=1 Tax=Caerostris extrusa TaxID=172846 RepID=A0AAV4VSH1_CAEEX|nr:hypothetical protein CEXT_184031 [Caerostris extrusa]
MLILPFTNLPYSDIVAELLVNNWPPSIVRLTRLELSVFQDPPKLKEELNLFVPQSCSLVFPSFAFSRPSWVGWPFSG